jgi:hypothetical protein
MSWFARIFSEKGTTMDKPKVEVENSGEAKRLQPANPERRSLLGWVRKKVRRIVNRRRKDRVLEIYPLY